RALWVPCDGICGAKILIMVQKAEMAQHCLTTLYQAYQTTQRDESDASWAHPAP
ncbi:hypothetical protein TUN199_11222, partial [Pyrenophora tritici-repentis]